MVCYLLVRRVILPITGVKVEVSILSRDLVSHGMLEGAVVDQRHCRGVVQLRSNK